MSGMVTAADTTAASKPADTSPAPRTAMRVPPRGQGSCNFAVGVRLKPVVLAVLLAAPSRLPYEAAASASSERGEGRVERDDEETASIGARVELYLRQHGTLGESGPAARLERSRREYERRRGEKRGLATKDAAADRWVSLGPTNGAGRMTSLAPHPTVMGTLYAGAAGGGVWKTVDDGASWIPLTDDLPDLAVGAIALAPSEPERIYLGTGEPVGMPGIGLLTSTDGGANWVLPSEVVANSFYRISVHPDRPLEVVAATDAGGLRSTDGGATWTSIPGRARRDRPGSHRGSHGPLRRNRHDAGLEVGRRRGERGPCAATASRPPVSDCRSPSALPIRRACMRPARSRAVRTSTGRRTAANRGPTSTRYGIPRINIWGTPDSGPTRSPCCRAAPKSSSREESPRSARPTAGRPGLRSRTRTPTSTTCVSRARRSGSPTTAASGAARMRGADRRGPQRRTGDAPVLLRGERPFQSEPGPGRRAGQRHLRARRCRRVPAGRS